jgi:hypothetical protein
LPVQAADLPALSTIAQLNVDLAALREECLETELLEIGYPLSFCVRLHRFRERSGELEALRRRFREVDRPATAEEVLFAVSIKFVNQLPMKETADKGVAADRLCDRFAKLKATPFMLETIATEAFEKGVWIPSAELDQLIKRVEEEVKQYRLIFKVADNWIKDCSDKEGQ